MNVARIAALCALSVAASAHPILAQPLGTFHWQLQPYCNVVTLVIAREGDVYTLDGSDDRCGAERGASATGIAFLNPDGTVGFGLTSVGPSGSPMHVDATISLPSMNGTWRDRAGNVGRFVLTSPLGTGGLLWVPPSGNLLPLGSVTSQQLADNAVAAAQLASNAVTGHHVADATLTGSDFAPASITAAHVASQSVVRAHIAPNAVDGSTIVDGAVGGADLAPNVITGRHVLDGGLTGRDFGDAPTSAFRSLSSSNPPDARLVSQVSIAAPVAGRVVVSTSGFVTVCCAPTRVTCALTTGVELDRPFFALRLSPEMVAYFRFPFFAARVFDVSAGSPMTFNLICEHGDATVSANLTALFVPDS